MTEVAELVSVLGAHKTLINEKIWEQNIILQIYYKYNYINTTFLKYCSSCDLYALYDI